LLSAIFGALEWSSSVARRAPMAIGTIQQALFMA
jgi:hypothetical protein